MMPAGFAAVLLTAVMAGETGLALNPLPASLSQDCFAELETGTAPEIACQFPITPSPQEREELEKGSRGYVKNFSCLLTVRISRAAIDKALTTNDYAFKSPEQPVV